MRLSAIPYKDIKIGLKVESARTGQHGIVSEKLFLRNDDEALAIKWQSGNKSIVWHLQADAINVI